MGHILSTIINGQMQNRLELQVRNKSCSEPHGKMPAMEPLDSLGNSTDFQTLKRLSPLLPARLILVFKDKLCRDYLQQSFWRMYPACGSPDLRAPQFSYFVWWPRSPRRPWTGFEFAERCASCNNRRSRCYSPVLGNVATQAQRAQVSCQDCIIKTQCEGTEETRKQRGLRRGEEPEG